MKRSRLWVIARHEWRATVLRREFLFVTLGLPVLILGIVACTTLATTATVIHTVQAQRGSTPAIAIYDPAHVLDPKAFSAPINDIPYRLVDNLEVAQSEVARGSLRAVVAIPGNYVQSGRTQLYRRKPDNLFSDDTPIPYANALRAGLLWRRAPPAVVGRMVQANDNEAVYEWDSEKRAFQPSGGLGEISEQMAKFVVPYAFAMLLMVGIITGTGYLLHGLVEEKENRVMEMLLSSATYEEIFRGKLIGLGAAGLTQIGAWILLAGVPALILVAALPNLIHVPVPTMLMALVLFVLGFSLYGSIMAGVGSLGTSWRESQQATAAITMCAIVPLMVMPVFLAEPNGVLARILSWFPLTAPIAIMMRIAITHIAWWDLLIGLTCLTTGVWVVQKFAIKLFRLGLLMYGKTPSVPEVWRWMVRA